jgi:NADPH-dependent curcumin reductase CurA
VVLVAGVRLPLGSRWSLGLGLGLKELYVNLAPQFLAEMGQWIAEGRVRWKETIIGGIENAPKAFLALFKGENFGKMLVRIGPDPAV